MIDEQNYGTFLDLLSSARDEICLPMLTTPPYEDTVAILKERGSKGVHIRLLLASPNVAKSIRGETAAEKAKKAINDWKEAIRDYSKIELRITHEVEDMCHMATSWTLDRRLLRYDFYDPRRQRSLEGYMIEFDSRAGLELNIISLFQARFKVGDACGLTCVFCHNEGTPIIPAQRKRGRVSIYEGSNGVNFMPGLMEPNQAFVTMLRSMIDTFGITEVHWTGGEPTLNRKLVELTQVANGLGLTVKMTSNGERAEFYLEKLHEAGLRGIVFSIFGTTPEELAQVQGPLYANKSFASRQILKLNSAIQQAIDLKLPVSANIVMSGPEHENRVIHLIEAYSGTSLQIRILSDLGVGFASSISIYNLLARLGAIPILREVFAGASNILVYYQLPNGQGVVFKQLRDTRLARVCGSCQFNNLNDCREGYYGIRVYVDDQGIYRVGVCIQRMDLTLPIEQFFKGDLPQAIKELRDYEYTAMIEAQGCNSNFCMA